MRSITPAVFLSPVLPLSLSLATTREISFDFSSSAYLDVSVRRVPRICLLFQHMLACHSHAGFPHSEIHGSMFICNSPWLIAACRVLRRLPMPRHPPYALFRLNFRLSNGKLKMDNGKLPDPHLSSSIQLTLVLCHFENCVYL